MPSKKNITKVKQLEDKLRKAKTVVLSDYRGLSVNQMQELRGQVVANDGELTVAKNRLLKIALRNAGLSDGKELGEALTGPTAILFCYGDEIEPVKTVYEYSKQNKLPELKVGFYGDDFLEQGRLISLAQLPTKQELQAKLVGVLNGPRAGLVNVLGGSMRKLVYTLNAIHDQKNK